MVVFDNNAELLLGCGGRLSAEVDNSAIIEIGYMIGMLSQDSHGELVIYDLALESNGYLDGIKPKNYGALSLVLDGRRILIDPESLKVHEVTCTVVTAATH